MLVRELIVAIKNQVANKEKYNPPLTSEALVVEFNRLIPPEASNVSERLRGVTTEDLIDLIWNINQISQQSRVSIEASSLSAVVKELSYSKKIDATSISKTIFALGKIAKQSKLNGKIDGNILQSLLTMLSERAPHVLSIANTIYSLGLLAKADRLDQLVDSSSLQALLTIMVAGQLSSQNISNTLYGLGELAKTRQLNGPIEGNILQVLLAQLVGLNPETQHIANSIYALGELAKANSLNVLIDAKTLDVLLAKLVELNPQNQHIANSVHGLGELAKAHQLSEPITGASLQPLLSILAESRRTIPQEISNTLYGLGELAKTQQLDGPIDGNTLQALLAKLVRLNPQTQHIANSIYALGELAKAHSLNVLIDANTLEALLAKLVELNPESQHIANSIYGLGKLAKSNRLHRPVDGSVLQSLLNKLGKTHPKPQEIANSVYGLGELAKAHQLSEPITLTSLQPLLSILANSPHPKPQEIANTIYGLGELAKANQLHGPVDAATLAALLGMLARANPTAQNIANSLYGLGELAKANRLHGQVDRGRLEELLAMLARANPTQQNIANSIYGLGGLSRTHSLSTEMPVSAIRPLLSRLNFSECNNPQDWNQLLQGLVDLRYTGVEHLDSLFAVTLRASYLHPGQVIKLLEYYANLLQYNPNLNPHVFEVLKSKLVLRFSSFNPKQQATLQAILTLLPANQQKSLSAKLDLSTITSRQPEIVDEEMGADDAWSSSESDEGSSVPPRLSANYHPEEISLSLDDYDGDAIFIAIRDNRLDELEKLLGVKPPNIPTGLVSKSSNTTERSGMRRMGTTPTSLAITDKKQAAKRMVAFFLQRTPPEYLIALIQQSTHHYFERLVRACGKHEQYQLAINYALNPIILHLPLSQLREFIHDLLRLGFYQDHRALLNVVEALFLRKQNQSDLVTTDELTHLQENLLTRGIEFHRHHRIVEPKLIDALQSIQESQELLFSDDNDYSDSMSYALGEEDRSVDVLDSPPPQPTPNRNYASPTSSYTSSSRYTLLPPPKKAPPPVIRNAFHEDALTHVDGAPNRNAWYTSEHIQALLTHKLAEASPNTEILAPLEFNQQRASDRDIRTHLLDFLTESQMHNDTQLILPICISDHWVGVGIKIVNRVAHISYYDSASSNAYEQLVLDPTAKAVQEIFQTTRVERHRRSCYMQDDASSCGVYLVENIVVDVLNLNPEEHTKSTLDWRAEHIEILKNSNKRSRDEYESETFVPRKRS